MARTKVAGNKGRETIAKGRESDMRASGQIRKIIRGILREEGKDRMYEERGAGTGSKERETNEKGNDNGSNDPHRRFARDKAHHNKHTTDHKKGKTCDSKGRETDGRETRGKEKAEGNKGGYKRPVLARHHKEGTDSHRQTHNRKGEHRGGEEGKAKDKAIKGNVGDSETLTGRHGARNLKGEDDNTNNRTNTTVMGTKPRKKSNDQRSQTTSFQRSGTERRRIKEDAETHTEEPETRTDQHKDPDTRQRRDPYGGATRQRRQHRIAKDSYTEDTDARDYTAKDTGGNDTYPLVIPDRRRPPTTTTAQ